jgi:3',5'-cyclic AMP phosphodiesterase CpdA
MQKLTIIHVSDFHFTDTSLNYRQLLQSRELFSKKSIGLLNVKFKRNKQFKLKQQIKVIKRLLALNWDYLVITGDLTSLATNTEYRLAKEMLAPLIKKGSVIIIPGNHDYYTPKALVSDLFKRYILKNPPKVLTSVSEKLPLIELNDQIVILNIDMVKPAPLYSSRGFISKEVLNVYQQVIKQKYKNHLKIAIGHYPVFLPDGIKEGYFHSFTGKRHLKSFLLENDIHLYLHGHIHKSWSFRPNAGNKLFSINSGGACRYSSGEWAGFHQIKINDQKIDIKRLLV